MRNQSKKGSGSTCLLFGARIAKYVFSLGIAAVLAFSAYTDLAAMSRPAAETSAGIDGSPAGAAAGHIESGAGEAVQAGGVVNGAGTVWADDGADAGDGAGEVQANEGMAAQNDDLQKRAALTFDDGPHPVYTKMLLDGLAERGVHATFFVIGKNIPGNEELIARMQQEGHLIGNHTYDHVKICDLSGAEACAQVEKTSALVREITGEDTEFVRPPFGAWNKSMECSFRMIPVLWDVDPLDWMTKNKALVEERVLSEVENGDIILLHDYYESSVEAALELVDTMQAQGYEFVTVDELILE